MQSPLLLLIYDPDILTALSVASFLQGPSGECGEQMAVIR